MVELEPGLSRSDSGLFVPNHENSANGLKHLPSNYRELIARKIGELDIMVPESGLELFDSPNPHDGSEAVYLLEQFMDQDWVLASHLEPNSKTSQHKHIDPMGTEQYYWLAGEAVLRVGGKDMLLNIEQNFRVVPLDTPHQLETKDNFALTLIVMKNAKLVPEGKLHIPVKF